MSNRITEQDSSRIKILAATGRYTPQEIATNFQDQYSVTQIVNHLKTKAPDLKSKLVRETSRGGVKLKAILAKIFPHVTIESEVHVGEKLRLDFYVGEPYNLGFEFDGVQHSKYTPGLHKDEGDFERGVAKDIRKEELCKGRGINLVRVAHDEDLDEELVQEKIDMVGHGTGYIKEGYETSKEKHKEKQKVLNQQVAERKRKQYQKHKKSDAYKANKQKQKEFRKESYKRQKAWKAKVKQSQS